MLLMIPFIPCMLDHVVQKIDLVLSLVTKFGKLVDKKIEMKLWKWKEEFGSVKLKEKQTRF